MVSDITILGWVHSLIGLAAIGSGLLCLFKYKFIRIDKPIGEFYLWSTFITSMSSLFLFNATGSFNIAHLLSIAIILMLFYALITNNYAKHILLNGYTKHLALTSTVYFSLIPTTGEVLTRWPGSGITEIDDPAITSTLLVFTVIFFVLTVYQMYKIYTRYYNLAKHNRQIK